MPKRLITTASTSISNGSLRTRGKESSAPLRDHFELPAVRRHESRDSGRSVHDEDAGDERRILAVEIRPRGTGRCIRMRMPDTQYREAEGLCKLVRFQPDRSAQDEALFPVRWSDILAWHGAEQGAATRLSATEQEAAGFLGCGSGRRPLDLAEHRPGHSDPLLTRPNRVLPRHRLLPRHRHSVLQSSPGPAKAPHSQGPHKPRQSGPSEGGLAPKYPSPSVDQDRDEQRTGCPSSACPFPLSSSR